MAPTFGSPPTARDRPSGSKLPITATGKERKSRQVRRQVSAWRTFGTGCRRPMAPDIVSIPKRTTAGGLALLSKYPMKPETRPDDHPDHFGRRRTARHARAAAQIAGVR